MGSEIVYSCKSRNHHYTVKYRYGGTFTPDEYYIYVDGEYAKTTYSEREMREKIDKMIKEEK